MAILTVGPTSTFPSIAAAMAAAGTGDIISLEDGYGNENATVTVDGLSFDGGPNSTDINLQLATGISALTLLGTAPINVIDGPDANTVVGNDGDNIISVSTGVDVVTAGNGTDRLIIDYSGATAAVTGTLVNVSDGGTHAVTFTGVENFTITTGSGNDTLTVGDGFNVLTTGAGNDTITAGNGPNIIDGGIGNDTITVGSGVNTILGGNGNDTIVAGDGGNTIDGGDGDDGITSGIGDDVVIAGLGNDTIVTSAGADVTTVSGGIDTVDSGSESDRLIVDFSGSTTNVNGGVTGGTLAGGYDGAFADVAGTSSVVFLGTENFTVTTGSGNDVIATGDGDDVLDGGAGSDQLNGGGGSDTLLIGLGNDALDGGADTDTVVFSAARSDYQVNDLGGGVIQTIDLRAGSPDGTDTLVNMEGFVFTDGSFDATTVLNDAPTLGGDLGIATANGGTIIVTVADLTATDSDNTNAQLIYTVTGALHGTVLLNGNAAASFTQANLVANAVAFQHDGTAINGSFSVSLTDGVAAPQVATVIVTEVNETPIAANDALGAVAEDNGQRTILGSALTGNDSTGSTNESGQALTITAVSNVIGGAAVVSGGNVLFTPTANFNGAASFDYTVTDNGVTNGAADPRTATATASFAVTAVNDAPSATNDALSAIAEDSGQRTILGSALTGNDSAGPANESGQTLNVTAVSNVVGGAAVVSGGNVLFTPTANFNGAASFNYTVTDDGTTNGVAAPLSVTATASFNVAAVNDAPTAQNGTADGTEDAVITGAVPAATDVDNASLAYSRVSQAAHGSVTVNADGTFSYTPNADFNGADSFSFKASDGTLDSNVGIVSLTVAAVNDAPINAVPGTQDIEANVSTAIGGLMISDVDAGAAPMTTTLGVAHGTLTVASASGAAVSGSGTGTVTLTGSLAQINTTLTASGNVVYRGARDYFSDDTLTITTNDNAGSGSGRARSDTDQVALHLHTHATGTPGNDSFTARSGNEQIEASIGSDTVTFAFKLVDATFTWSGNQVIVDSPSGHTVLSGFETYVFADGTVNNNDGNALVDDLFYYAHNHDVWSAHADADAHYHQYGWHEGRDPDAFFSTSLYLGANPDVAAANIDPLAHFAQYGWQEGRVPSVDFDPHQYLAANPDVAAAHVDPLGHFLQYGAQEGRQPFAGVGTTNNLPAYPDVAAAHVDPVQHFLTFGIQDSQSRQGDGHFG